MWSDKEKGQTLLIVVLVMVVSLTVGLAAVSRSITSLRTSTEEASSQAAFSAAEAGVERVLKTGIDIANQLLGNALIKEARVTSISGTEFLVNNGSLIPKDDGVDVWLIEHNSDGTLNYSSGWQTIPMAAKLTIYWGSSSDTCSNAALEIIAISGSSTAPISTRYALDPCGSRRNTNYFAAPDSGNYPAQGKNFYYREMINIPSSSKGLMVRIIPLYFNTPIAIKGCHKNFPPDDSRCNALPAQGSIITSTGESGSTQRKITLFQGYPRVPLEFFQYVLFSPR